MNPPALSDIILVTSNSSKIKEFQRLGHQDLHIEPGADLDEVMGTPDEIIIHKAIAAGEGRMVEDSILVVDGQPLVDVKWRIDALLRGEYPLGASLVWEVRLGVMHQGVVHAYLGQTHGTLCAYETEGFGMDPIFRVSGVNKSLAALDKENCKDIYSARLAALSKVISGTPYLSIQVGEVPAWTGTYQSA